MRQKCFLGPNHTLQFEHKRSLSLILIDKPLLPTENNWRDKKKITVWCFSYLHRINTKIELWQNKQALPQIQLISRSLWKPLNKNKESIQDRAGGGIVYIPTEEHLAWKVSICKFCLKKCTIHTYTSKNYKSYKVPYWWIVWKHTQILHVAFLDVAALWRLVWQCTNH